MSCCDLMSDEKLDLIGDTEFTKKIRETAAYVKEKLNNCE